MGIFSKKYDYEDDRLEFKYDLDTDQYYCSSRNQGKINTKQLNFKSRRKLKKKNIMTEEEKYRARALAQHEKRQHEEFKKRNDAIEARNANGWPTMIYDSFETLNDNGYETRFSNEVKAYLSELTSEQNNSDYIVGIHRIGSSEDYLENIFNQGIIVQGHEGGAARGTPELKNTVGYYPNNSTIMKEVAFANQYKDSKGSIVVKIPKEDIVANNIYVTDKEGKNMYLNPKYIVGYFPVEEDKTVNQLVTRSSLSDYREERRKEAERYISMGDKIVSYPPPEMD